MIAISKNSFLYIEPFQYTVEEYLHHMCAVGKNSFLHIKLF